MNIIYLIEAVRDELPKDMPARFNIELGAIQREIELIASPIVGAETGLVIQWSCGLGIKNCVIIDSHPIIGTLLIKRTLVSLLLRLLDKAAITMDSIKSESLGDATIVSNDEAIVKALNDALDAVRIEYESILKAFKQPMGLRYDTENVSE